MSATAVLGIEAARIYISRDSIKILDKLNKRYLTQSYSYFTRFSDVPLTLEVLQNLFVGNQILELDDTLKTVQPDVLVKGGDYKPGDIVGYDIVTAKGGNVTTIDFVPGFSTSAIEQKIKQS